MGGGGGRRGVMAVRRVASKHVFFVFKAFNTRFLK